MLRPLENTLTYRKKSIQLAIVIPIYLQNQLDYERLKKCLNSIYIQKSWPREIVITDDSPSKIFDANDLSVEAEFLNLIKYFQNPARMGLSKNYNNAVEKCSCEWIHFFAQDDYYNVTNAIEILQANIQNSNGRNWFLIKGKAPGLKEWNPKISIATLLGINSIGGLSSLLISRDLNNKLDENIIQLVDCELYWRLHNISPNFGLINDHIFTYGLGMHQTSKQIKYRQTAREISYLVKKYKIPKGLVLDTYKNHLLLPESDIILYSQFKFRFMLLKTKRRAKRIWERLILNRQYN